MKTRLLLRSLKSPSGLRRRSPLAGLILGIAILGLAGCQCGGKVVGADSELVVEPASIDFGSVAAGSQHSRQLVARVTGRLTIPIREVRIDQGARTAFSTTAAEVTIEPGGELRFAVRYDAPGISGVDEATLVLVTSTQEVLVPLRAQVAVVFCEITECGTRCGQVSDGCGGTLDCGACNTCVPRTCFELGAICGAVSDGCGATLDCGACARNATCQNNQCVTTCVPQTCASLSATCGAIGDGCGGMLNCGGCGPGATCAQNQCTCASSGNEVCGDGVDNDCDGAVDCTDTQCATDAACMQPACTITDPETQVTQSAFGVSGGFLSWTGSEWGLFLHEDTGSTNMRYAYQRLTAQGQPSGVSVDVSGTGVAHRPFAAWTGSEFGLAWSDVRNFTQQNDVFFNRVSPTGQRMLPSNVDISVQAGLAFPSSIAWNPVAQEFGVLWGDDRVAGPGNDRALFFRRVDVMGNLAGPEVRLTPAPTAGVTTDYSDVTWGGSNWGIVATQQRSGTPFMLFNRLSANGSPELSDLQLNANGRGAYNPRIASNPTHYAAVFHEYDSGFVRTDVVLTLIAKSGPANPVRVVLTSSGTAANATVVWTGSSWAVVYEDGRTGVRRLSYAKLDASGARLAPDSLLSCVTAGTLMPHVAYDGTRLGVTWASLVAGKYQSFIKTFAP